MVAGNEQKSSLDERFTNLADIVSEGMGKWWVTAISVLLIALWTLYCMLTQGPAWWYGQFYNFPLNLATTVAELWIGFLLAAATNRVERRHDALLEQIKARTVTDLHTTQHDAETNRQAEKKIDALTQDMQTIKRMLAKVVTEA